MERHPVQVLPDPATDLDEPEAQGPKLDVRDRALFEPATDGIEHPVGSAVQEQPALIGPEAVAGEPISEAVILEVLEAQLGPIAAPGVPGVKQGALPLGRIGRHQGEIGREEGPCLVADVGGVSFARLRARSLRISPADVRSMR